MIAHPAASENIQANALPDALGIPGYLIDSPMICVAESGMHSFGLFNILWGNLPAAIKIQL